MAREIELRVLNAITGDLVAKFSIYRTCSVGGAKQAIEEMLGLREECQRLLAGQPGEERPLVDRTLLSELVDGGADSLELKLVKQPHPKEASCLAMLAAGESSARKDACDMLGLLYGSTPAAMVALRQALEADPDGVVRSRAAQAFGRLRDGVSSCLLREALRTDRSYLARFKAAEALGRMEGEETEANALALCGALRGDKLQSVRCQAADALCEVLCMELSQFSPERRQAIRNEIAAALVLARTSDPNEKVRGVAHTALLRFGAPGMSCVQESSEAARAEIVVAVFSALGLQSVLPEFLRAFADHFMVARIEASVVLGKHMDESASRFHGYWRSRRRTRGPGNITSASMPEA